MLWCPIAVSALMGVALEGLWGMCPTERVTETRSGAVPLAVMLGPRGLAKILLKS